MILNIFQLHPWCFVSSKEYIKIGWTWRDLPDQLSVRWCFRCLGSSGIISSVLHYIGHNQWISMTGGSKYLKIHLYVRWCIVVVIILLLLVNSLLLLWLWTVCGSASSINGQSLTVQGDWVLVCTTICGKWGNMILSYALIILCPSV